MKLVTSLFTTFIWHLMVVRSQQFNGSQFFIDFTGISEPCVLAINTTLSACPPSLLDSADNNFRLPADKLARLCQNECLNSLNVVRDKIISSCNSTSDLLTWQARKWPATMIVDRFIFAYQRRCRKDTETGQFCDVIFTSWLETPVTDEMLCSDCTLGIRQIWLNSSLGYEEDMATEFASATASCSKTGYTYTVPSTSSVIATVPTNVRRSNADSTCYNQYETTDEDSCETISVMHNVSTFAITRTGISDAFCSRLPPGQKLCLPPPCRVYKVASGDTCNSIVAAHPWISLARLAQWNPNIDPACRYLELMAGSYICVGDSEIVKPGSRFEYVATITPSSVTKPTNAPAESNGNCAEWYNVQEGDYCALISIRKHITLDDFLFLNPELDLNCTNLLLGCAYCVRAVGDISTYPGYTSTARPYSLTAMTFTTTGGARLSSWIRSPTTLPPLPTAPGTTSNCTFWIDRPPFPQVEDQAMNPVYTNQQLLTDNCAYALLGLNTSLDEFVALNPLLSNGTSCTLQGVYRYCASNASDVGFMDVIVDGNRCVVVNGTYLNTTTTCSCFTNINGYAYGNYSCTDIAEDYSITVEDLKAWNPWIGNDCDAGVFAGMTDTDQRAVCVGVPGYNISTATTTSTTADSSSSAATIATTTSTANVGVSGSARSHHLKKHVLLREHGGNP